MAQGKYVTHNTYGEQFKIDTFEKVLPNSLVEIEKYLGSGIIKGVGPVTSKRIVDKFGEETIYTLRFEPNRLAEISGITGAKALTISEEFNQQWELWQIVLFLQKYQIGTVNANRVYKELGINAIKLIEENPYILLNILYGVDFKVVDKMALDMGLEECSPSRIASGIKYALMLASRNGHTCVLEQNLLEYVSNILGVEEELVKNELTSLCYAREICVEDGYAFLKPYFTAEENIAKKLLMMCNDNVKRLHSLDSKIEETEKELKIDLSEEQRKAVRGVFANKVMIITGGPGTGKTTIIKLIIKLFQKEGMDIALAAPTGRAAKRMTETTGEDAKTLHRLLELGKLDDDKISIDYDVAHIDKDVVIVDEVSMIDVVLMSLLIKGISDKTRLILIGDANQLPSVGPGSVLKDLIESDMIPTAKLTEIYRQAKESQIVLNAHAINHGEMIDLEKREGDFYFIKSTNPVGNILDMMENKFKDYDKLKDIQVLTPTKKGDTGTRNLNKELQALLNPKNSFKKEKEFGEIVFREGDKVMQIRNNYDVYWESKDGKSYGSGIYNGDLGIIDMISEDGVRVIFDEDKVVLYEGSVLEELEHAYAITIHKSQGSEFPVVIMPIISGPPMLYTRNLLYTGVTRAKELLIVVGNENVVKYMINNANTKNRNTGLKYKLEKYMQIFNDM
ncbi:MAG: ATP-dependent RecD-like DNA helicase [Clostridia bacterium]|nr:ATP-dependent RecD-like DNA helicase [Clostridia bacterium]